MDNLNRLLIDHADAIYNAALFGPIIVVALLEPFAARRRQTAPLGQRWIGNVAFGVGAVFVARWVTLGLGVGAASAAGLGDHGLLGLIDLPAWLAFVVAFVLLDLAQYALHRLAHVVPWLWRCHRVHHMDPDVDFTTSQRHHPFEVAYTAAFYVALYAALGVPAAAVIAHGSLSAAAAVFNHANLALPRWLDGVLRFALVTPDVHRAHHSALRSETDSNYGNLLTWWDRLFRTWTAVPAGGHDGMTLGLHEFSAPADLRLDRLLLNPLIGARAAS